MVARRNRDGARRRDSRLTHSDQLPARLLCISSTPPLVNILHATTHDHHPVTRTH